MPQIVELPGNLEVEFPDGMSQQEIDRVIQNKFPEFAKPSEPLRDERTLLEKSSGALVGITSVAEATANALAHPIKSFERFIEGGAIATGLAEPGSQLIVRPSELIAQPIADIPRIPQQEGKTAQVAAGIGNAVIDFAEFFLTPEGAATLGIGALPKAAQKAVIGAFSMQMATQAPQELQAAVEQAKGGNLQEAARHATAGTGAAVLSGLMAKHVAGEAKAVAPKTAEALDRAVEPTAPVTPEALTPQPLGIQPPGAGILQKAIDFFRKPKGASGEVSIDYANQLPRPQEYAQAKKLAADPQGFGHVPGLGKLFDPRAGALTEPERAIIANAQTRYMGQSVGAIIVEVEKAKGDAFKADELGQVTLADSSKGFISDVIEAEMGSPGSQPLTPAQKSFVHEVWEPLLENARSMIADEKVKGALSIEEGEAVPQSGPYFPRPRIGTVGEPAPTPPTAARGKSVGARQFFQKERFYETEAAGREAQVKYDPDAASRMGKFISGVYKAVADTRLANDPALEARPAAEGPPRFEREGFVGQPAFQGQVFPKEIADKLNSFYGESSHDWVRKTGRLTNLIKGVQLTLDISAPLVQGLPTLFFRPSVWARGVVNSTRAMFDAKFMGRQLAEPGTARAASELVQLGVPLRRLQDFMAGLEQGEILPRIPLVGPAAKATGRAFSGFMDLAKIELWKAMREVYPKEQWKEAAETIESITLSSRMEEIGVQPGRALGERIMFMAPSYYRAGVNIVANAFQRGVSGEITRAAMARFMGGVLLTSTAGMIAAGLNWDEIQERLDPSKGKFLKVPVSIGDRVVEVGFGNIMTSFARLLGETVEWSDQPINTGVEDNPLLKWFRGKLGPVPSFAGDVWTGADITGKEVGIIEAAARRLQPITIAQLTTGEGTLKERATDAAFSFFGLQAFPQSTRELFFRERERMAQEKFSKPYEDLRLREQVGIVRDLQKDERFAKKPSTERERELAHRADIERQKRLQEALTPENQEKLKGATLNVTGYEPVLTVAGTRMPLTRSQQERFEALIAQEYNSVVGRLDSNKLARAEQTQFNKFLTAAKERARARFMAEQNRR